MNRHTIYLIRFAAIACLTFSSCTQPAYQYVDFDTFHPTKITESVILEEDGRLNPAIQLPEELSLPATDGDADSDSASARPRRIASTTMSDMMRDWLGNVKRNKVIQIAGTYTGHDTDGSALTLSGKQFVLCQMMSERRYQPRERNENASIHGIPIISFGLIPFHFLGTTYIALSF